MVEASLECLQQRCVRFVRALMHPSCAQEQFRHRSLGALAIISHICPARRFLGCSLSFLLADAFLFRMQLLLPHCPEHLHIGALCVSMPDLFCELSCGVMVPDGV